MNRETFRRLDLAARNAFPGSTLLRAWPLAGGISADMIALELKMRHSVTVKVIFRRHLHQDAANVPSAVENEARLLQITRSMGLPTPEPYFLDLSREVFPQDYSLIEYIDGRMEFAPADLAGTLEQLAEQLANLHNADISQYDLSYVPQHLGECVELSRDHGGGPAGGKHIAEALHSTRPPEQKNRHVLLHGDYWPGNALWRDGRLLAIIDWEDAEIGDPLIDLARSRSEIVWIYGIEAMHSFTRHYQARTTFDFTGLPYWDLCAALRQLRLAASGLAGVVDYFTPYGRSDITMTSIAHNLDAFIAQAMDRLQLP